MDDLWRFLNINPGAVIAGFLAFLGLLVWSGILVGMLLRYVVILFRGWPPATLEEYEEEDEQTRGESRV